MTNMTNLARGRQRYVASVCFLLLMVGVLFAYRDTFAAMVGIWWRSETFTHAFLVPPIVAWMVWREREKLKYIPFKPNAWMLIPLLGIGLFWLLGDLVAVNAVTQFAAIAMLVLLVPLVLGLAVARHLIFPLAFLFFCVPFGEFAMPQLMEWTADFTVLALRATGIPVYREGLQFVIPSGNWSVVEACSGVRYLIASLTVGTLFAYLNYKSIHRRLMFIVVSALVPILANWLRAYMIVMLGHVSGNKLAAGVDHLIYGWVFFGIVILLMFMIGAKWADMPVGAVPKTLEHITKFPAPVMDDSFKGLWIVGAVAAVLLVMPHFARLKIDSWTSKEKVELPQDMQLGGGWTKAEHPVSEWLPDFKNPSAVSVQNLQKGEQKLGVYVAYYRQQGYQRKLVSSENVLAKSKGSSWVQISSSNSNLGFSGINVNVRQALLKGPDLLNSTVGATLTVRQVYWINGKLTASDMKAKLYGAFSSLVGEGDDSAVIILYSPNDPNHLGASVFDDFLSDNSRNLLGMLEKIAANGRK